MKPKAAEMTGIKSVKPMPNAIIPEHCGAGMSDATKDMMRKNGIKIRPMKPYKIASILPS